MQHPLFRLPVIEMIVIDVRDNGAKRAVFKEKEAIALVCLSDKVGTCTVASIIAQTRDDAPNGVRGIRTCLDKDVGQQR